MTKRIWDGAVLISLMIALSVALAMPALAGDFKPESAFGANTVAMEGMLESVRGKGAADTAMDNLLSATLADNTSSNLGSISANNSILDNAFAGSSGVLTVIQNAADNVIIQSSTSLTVNFMP